MGIVGVGGIRFSYAVEVGDLVRVRDEGWLTVSCIGWIITKG